jgi:hypothetical protein
LARTNDHAKAVLMPSDTPGETGSRPAEHPDVNQAG